MGSMGCCSLLCCEVGDFNYNCCYANCATVCTDGSFVCSNGSTGSGGISNIGSGISSILSNLFGGCSGTGYGPGVVRGTGAVGAGVASSSTSKLLLLGAIGVGAYLMLKKK